MKEKTARVYTLDELKDKCQKVLANPKLLWIVKIAPLNKNGKINLSWVYKEAEKYVHEQTKDLQKTKELALETRFLAMLRRDFEEEYEKLVLQKEQSKEETRTEAHKKLFHEIEFELPHEGMSGIELITRKTGCGHRTTVDDSIRFRSDVSNDRFEPRRVGTQFCFRILDALIETADPPGDIPLTHALIQRLEEKFRLRIKVCGNCKHFTLLKRYLYVPVVGKESEGFVINGRCKVGSSINVKTEFDPCDCGQWKLEEVIRRLCGHCGAELKINGYFYVCPNDSTRRYIEIDGFLKPFIMNPME